ncbi:MAG: leucine-rich repeat domain-containing protein [Clostridia bacterium]|nr:leucine-rich repeat domain-containing protein [Clostridia bacterium]
MKSRLLKILILVFCVSFALFAVSCNENKDNSNSESESITIQSESIEESEEVSQSESELESETESDFEIQNETGILFKTLTVDGTNVYGKFDNATIEFSFANEIAVVGNADFIVSLDSYGTQTVITKTVPLNVGDNTFYVFETIEGKLVKTYVVTIRRRPIYTVSFNVSGGSSVSSQQIEEDSLATEPTTTRTGYTFTGWDYDFSTPIVNNLTISANWKAHTNTEYKVEYYLQNVEDDNYTLDHTDTLCGTTDTLATAEIKDFAHFTYNASQSTISGNIDGNGSRVLVVKYTRNKYTISTARNNEKAGSVTGAGTYKFDKEITLTATTNAGYTFLGWYDGEDLVCESEEFTFNVEKGVTYTATWFTHTDTEYKVEYYLQNLDDDNYTLDHTDELEGTTDTTATAEIKTFEHFTYSASKSTASGNINGDGSRVLVVKYTRDKYTISPDRNNTKAGTVVGAGTYKFDKEITLTATTNAGYTWLGWYEGEDLVCESEEFTFNAEKGVTYTATWFTHTDTEYKVEYYLQNFEDDNYALDHTDTLCGTTDTLATAEIKDFAHFTYNASASTISGNIDGDGSRVLVVKYTRDKYGIVANNNNAKAGISTQINGTYKFDKEITLTATTNAGYTFLGWYEGETLVCDSVEFTFNVEKNVTYTATWYENEEMANFNFTSTTTSCTITGVKDKTVTEISVPDCVTNINSGAFSGCSNLQNITLPFVGGSKTATTASASTLFGYIFGTSSYTGSYSAKQYYEGGSYTTYYIPSSLTSVTITGGNIFYCAFYNLDSLTSVEIGDSVTSIGAYAFRDCDSLTSVEIGDSVTTIGDYAFEYCYSLTSVVIGDSVTSIGSYAFYDCGKLVEVINNSSHITVTKGSSSNGYVGCYALSVFNKGDTYVNKFTNDNGYIIYTDGEEKILVDYNGTQTDLVIPDYITQINGYAFRDSDSLTSVEIPDSVTTIGFRAFYDCDSLTSVEIPDSVTTIGYSAFSDCYSLTSVVIGDSVTTIGDYAFYYCSSLTSVVIGDSVTTIGEFAFSDCYSLTSVTFKDTSTWYYTSNYSYTGGTSINVTSPTQNATDLKIVYYTYYWYKV